jgi:hypothetical protein
MGDYNPVRANGAVPFTLKAGAAQVTGGQVVMASANGTVAPGSATGGAAACGVAAFDAVSTDANGGVLAVWPLDGVEHIVACPGGIAAGDGVKCGDAGIIVAAPPSGGPPTALATAAAAGTLIGICTVGCDADEEGDTGHTAQFIGRG